MTDSNFIWFSAISVRDLANNCWSLSIDWWWEEAVSASSQMCHQKVGTSRFVEGRQKAFKECSTLIWGQQSHIQRRASTVTRLITVQVNENGLTLNIENVTSHSFDMTFNKGEPNTWFTRLANTSCRTAARLLQPRSLLPKQNRTEKLILREPSKN